MVEILSLSAGILPINPLTARPEKNNTKSVYGQ